MNTKRRINTRGILGLTAAVLAAGVSLASLPPVHADTLTFTNAPAGDVAAAMSKRFGVTIVFRGSLNKSLPATFSVDDPDSPGARLQAVSNLATALDADFQKVYVVSKVDPGAAVPTVPLDSNGPIVFRSTHVSARQAIQTVAAVDSAVTQISGAVTGDVVFAGTHESASDAAAIIAKQTGTEWKAYYGLFKRGEAPSRLNGTVLDRTSNGQPITQQPLLSYRNTIAVPAQLHSGQEAAAGLLSPLSTNPNVASVANTNFGFADPYGFGGFGDPYGYANPYGPYGYAAPDGSFATPGSVVTPGVGVSPVVPGVNAPPANAAAGPNGTAILPGFPSMGSVGSVPVGSY